MDKYDILEKQIDWKNLLIANYKELGLSEDEVICIFVCQYCIDRNEKTITPELLSIITNYNINKCSQLLTSLVNKSFILFEEDENGKLLTTLKGIKRVLINDFIKNEENGEKEEETSLYSLFENEFGRPLSFAEIETLKSWINQGISEDKIRLALKEAIENQVKNMRYIDKILITLYQQEEIKKEGYTTITDSWRKNMKESIDSINEKNK